MFKFLSYLLIIPIWFYQKLISPFFPSTCRFNPTCSNYAIESLKEKGPFKGFWLALKRILIKRTVNRNWPLKKVGNANAK